LGKATPTCFLLVPFYDRDEFLGVLELAFFKPLENYEKEFAERIAENFAGALSAVRKNKHNNKLLEESQLITEQMRAQEEEMRQNMEELQATQEVANQQVREAEMQMNALESVFCVLELSSDRKVVSANNTFLKALGYEMSQLTSRHIKEVLKPGYEYSNTYLDLWDNAEKGKSFPLDLEFRALDTHPVWLHGIAYPIAGHSGVLQRLIFIAADYTLEKHEIQALREQVEKQTKAVD
jgi:PAS domain-containing protein